MPQASSVPVRKFSTTTSAVATRSRKSRRPDSTCKSIVIERLLRFAAWLM
jgi:hypothetical protein